MLETLLHTNLFISACVLLCKMWNVSIFHRSIDALLIFLIIEIGRLRLENILGCFNFLYQTFDSVRKKACYLKCLFLFFCGPIMVQFILSLTAWLQMFCLICLVWEKWDHFDDRYLETFSFFSVCTMNQRIFYFFLLV